MRTTALLLVPLLFLGIGCGDDESGHFENPDLAQKDASDVGPDMATETPDMATEAPDMTTETPDMATEAPDMGTEAPDMTTEASDMATEAPDMATETPDMATEAPDMATEAPDMATEAPDMTAETPDMTAEPDLSGGTCAKTTCAVVINEIQTGTAAVSKGGNGATDEFVEIYNPCIDAIDLTGWTLVYRAASNTDTTGDPNKDSNPSKPLFTFTGPLAAGGYLVYSGAAFTGHSDGALVNSIAASGAVGIRDTSGALIDSVGYGTIADGNPFIETAVAVTPGEVASPGKSISRMPNGHDCNNNSTDFVVTAPPTPGAANVAP